MVPSPASSDHSNTPPVWRGAHGDGPNQQVTPKEPIVRRCLNCRCVALGPGLNVHEEQLSPEVRVALLFSDGLCSVLCEDEYRKRNGFPARRTA